MTAFVLIIAFGLAAVLLFVYFTRRRAVDLSDYGSLSQQLQPIPVSALLNLIDPAQQEYLQRNLSKADFTRLQRMRNRALREYFRAIYRNAGILLQLAYAAVESERPEVVEAGRELLDQAMLTRTLAIRALMRLAGARVIPVPVANLVPAVTKYAIATARSTSLAAMLEGQAVSA